MKKASEYREHAQQCRVLAAQMELPDQRAQMLQMADHWEKLARDRADLIANHPELAQDGEQAEEHSFAAGRPPPPADPAA